MNIDACDALLLVDIQKDFSPGGALAVKEGDLILEPLNRLIPLFEKVIATRDWHPADHCSFDPDPKYIDGSWPVHCVAGTEGAQFHPDLKLPPGAWIIDKGTEKDREAYSGFSDPTLVDRLKQAGVRRLFVGGLATDYCVKNTVLDALARGFEVVLLTDAVRGVDLPEGNVAKALEGMARAGATLRTSQKLE